MSIEIERKFLVRNDSYRTQAFSYYDILQGYIAHENGRSVRVRITDKEAILTIKGPSDSKGMSRYEWNHVIPVEDARELFELHQSGAIEKRRYLVHSGPHVFAWTRKSQFIAVAVAALPMQPVSLLTLAISV